MIEYPIGTSGRKLILSDAVLQHFAKHRQTRWYHREAGGQLFARFLDGNLEVVEATGPRRTDRRGRYHYIPDRTAEQTEIDERFPRGLNFVGDWHTHPEDRPSPSSRDETSIAETTVKSSHALNGLLLIIVGRRRPPRSIHVAISDGIEQYELQPTGTIRQAIRKVHWI